MNPAISLPAADDVLRSRLVPINRRYPIADLERAAIEYRETTGRRVSIEWTMMHRVNDTDDQARLLASFAQRTRAHVNLIPLNPTPLTKETPSSNRRIAGFIRVLTDLGVRATVRDTRGTDIDAACGQLRANNHPVGTSTAVTVRARS